MKRYVEPQGLRTGLSELGRLRRSGELRAHAHGVVRRLWSPETLGQRATASSLWMMAEQVVRMGLTFGVTVLVIRHLGPEDFGLLSYGIAVVMMVGLVGTLGMPTIMVREILDRPEAEPEVLGTGIVLRLITSVAITAAVILVLWLLGTDSRALTVLLLVSLGLPLWAVSNLEVAFQASLRGGYIFAAKVGGVVTAVSLRVVLLVMDAPLMAFAVAAAVEVAAIGIGFAIAYWWARRERRVASSPMRRPRVTKRMTRHILRLSWPLLISVLAAALYLKVDQVMLLHMVGPAEVGIYAAGSRIAEIWHFIPIAVANALMPVLVQRFKEDAHAYDAALQRGYDATCWMAIALVVGITITAPLVVLLFGPEFERTADILRVHVWSAPFIFMGNVLSRALITEDRRKFELVRHVSGASLNIVLNLFLIPLFGGIGAALATILSYAFSSYFICVAYRPARPHVRRMTAAFIIPLRWRGARSVDV